MPREPLETVVAFLQDLGLRVEQGAVAADSFLPGVTLVPNGIRYDPAQLLSPGDLLHEAGHLAVLRPEQRAVASGTLQAGPEEEMAAIAWSWAALTRLALPPALLFHPQGYKGQSAGLMLGCQLGVVPGVAVLQRLGLCPEGAYPQLSPWLLAG